MIRVVALDGNGIPRVYGDGPTMDIAETRCRDELLEYLKTRKEMRLTDFVLDRHNFSPT